MAFGEDWVGRGVIAVEAQEIDQIIAGRKLSGDHAAFSF